MIVSEPTSPLERERQRLLSGAYGRPDGIGTVRFIVRTTTDRPADIVARTREVLLIVNEASRVVWPSAEKWRKLLPSWFVASCAPERSKQEADAWLAQWEAMSWEEKQRVERDKRWSLQNWLYCFQPEERTWYWWDAANIDDGSAIVAVEVESWPFPWGELSWLLRAAGAETVDPERDDT